MQKKIVIFVAIGFLVAFGLLSFLGVRALNESTQRTLAERLVIARMVAQGLEQALGEAQSQLEKFANLEAADLEDGDLGPEIKALGDLRSYSGFFTSNFLLDGEGYVLWTQPYDASLVGTDLLSYTNVAETLETGAATVASIPGGGSMVSLSAPLRNEARAITGVIGGNIDLAGGAISSMIQPIQLGKTAYTEIVNEAGQVMAITKPGETAGTYEITEHAERFAALIREGNTTVGTCHRCHEARGEGRRQRDVLAFAPLSTIPWGVAIRQSEEEALAPTRDLKRDLFFVGIPIFLIGLVLTWLGTRSIVKPLVRLTAASRRMAAGDLEEPVALGGGGEIGTLARTFEEMRTKLKISRDEIEERAQEIEHRASELSALNTIAATVSQSLDLDQVLESALEKVLETVQVEAGGIFTIEEGNLVLQAHRRLSPQSIEKITRWGSGIGFSGRVVRFTEPVSAEAELGFFTNVPLTSKGKILGSLTLATRRQRELSPRDVELLSAIGHQIGVAIDNAQLFREAQRGEGEAEALHKLGVEISALLDLDKILNTVVENARQLLGTEVATLSLLDEQSQEVYIRAISGTMGQGLKEVRLRVGQGVAGRVIELGQPLALEDYLADSTIVHVPEVDALVREDGLKAYLAVPLKIGERVFGSLVVANRRAHKFPERDLDLLSRLANQAAVAIENARLYSQVQDMAVLEERDRIAREMHDGLGQVLGYLNLKARAVEDYLASSETPLAQEELKEMRKVTREAYDEVRQGILSLRATVSPGVGLIPTLEEYLEGFKEQSGIAVELMVHDASATEFPSRVEVQLVRIIQEALANVRKHAQAEEARVIFDRDGDQARITIEDNGRGFDPEKVTQRRGQRFGLLTMRERAESVGGTFAVDSKPGQGTKVVVRLPLGAEERR